MLYLQCNEYCNHNDSTICLRYVVGESGLSIRTGMRDRYISDKARGLGGALVENEVLTELKEKKEVCVVNS